MKNISKKIYTKEDKKFIQKIFDIYITRIRQSFFKNEKGYIKLLEKEKRFDIFIMSNSNPHKIERYIHKKDKFFKSLIEFCYYFYCDIKNFYKLFLALILYKNIVISSNRWVKNKFQYQKEILNNIDAELSRNCKFVYFQIKTLDADNTLIINLREKLYRIFINNFDQLSKIYQIKILKAYEGKVKYLLNNNNLDEIKKIINQNYFNNFNHFNKYNPSNFILIIYMLFGKIIQLTKLNKKIYLINTNLWSINNLLIENILFKTDIEIIGCQHGGIYLEKKDLYCDYEIYCPSFNKFLSFNLSNHKINPSLILNLNESSDSGLITYISGQFFTDNKIGKNQIKIFNILKKLSSKYDCSIRIHPNGDLKRFKSYLKNYFKDDINLNEIKIFQVKNKNIAISSKAKVCIFDYPHSTLFWDAFNKGLKTVLVYETRNNRQISKKYLSLYDLIINPKSDNWEEPFNNLIQ